MRYLVVMKAHGLANEMRLLREASDCKTIWISCLVESRTYEKENLF